MATPTLDLVVHHFTKVPGTNEMRLVKINPYVRIAHGAEPPLFIQGGRIFSEGGPEMPTEQLPAWWDKEVSKLSPAVRAEVGLVAPKPTK
jgi:hypothetical protein